MSEEVQVQDVPQVETTELESWEDAGLEGDLDEITEEVPASFEELADGVEVSEPESSEQSTEEVTEAPEEGSESDKELSSEEGSEAVSSSSEEEGAGEENREPQLFKVKVDGEEQDVSLEDLKSNYSGKVAYDKKFNELNLERKQHEAEITEINNYINHFANLMKEGDAMGAMSYFAEFGGVAPHEFEQQLIKSLMPVIDRYREMDPNEIDLEYKNKEADYYRRQMESVQEQTKLQQANQELSAKEASIREANYFTSEEWDQASAYVKEHLENRDDYSPELVRDFMLNEKAENAVEAVDANLLDNKVFMSAFETLVRDTPEATHEDLVSHLKSLYEEKVEEPKKEEVKQELAKKITKTNKQLTKKEEVSIEPIKDEYGNEVEDWDDFI